MVMIKVLIFILSSAMMFGSVEIESLNPNEGEAGSSLSVELTASNINFYDGYSSVNNVNFIPNNINVDSFSISSSNTITLNLDIDKIPPTWFDVELVGEFYDQYDQYANNPSKNDAFFVSSNNPLLVVDFTESNDFGDVNVGDTALLPLSLYNPSTVDLQIFGISMTNSNFSINEEISSIGAGETVTEVIVFEPSSIGQQDNTISIYSNDEYDPVIVLQMSGNGVGILGDINLDGGINILDIVALISFVFNDNENPFADLNGDGSVNIVDVVMLVNLVLNYGF
tara:strand:- start:693 stop:1541 length:849 start_codon:yes stop_codon:yes gene_type:complete